jgi:striatin 1/3/4
LDDPSNAG